MMTDPAASRPGTHLDPDTMADLLEGLLDPAAAEGARTHLASCPLCSADFALIAGQAGPAESGLGEGGLGALLPPTPIPQDVVARVEAALHREPPLGTAQTPVGHAAPRPRRRRFRLALGSLAGAALVVAGGIGVLTATNSGSSSKSSSSTAAANGAQSGAQSTRPGEGSRAAGEAPSQESPAIGGHSAGSSGSFGSRSIEQQAQDLLGQRGESAVSGTAAAKPQCSPSTVAPGTKLLASTQTSYQGRQAWLLVYAEPGTTTRADVYVVDLDSCTSGNHGQVAYQTTVARP